MTAKEANKITKEVLKVEKEKRLKMVYDPQLIEKVLKEIDKKSKEGEFSTWIKEDDYFKCWSYRNFDTNDHEVSPEIIHLKSLGYCVETLPGQITSLSIKISWKK